jgi:hypothetical protein
MFIKTKTRRGLIWLVWLLIFTFLTSTCTRKHSFPHQTPQHAVEFGHGGGFAGIEHRYILLPNGQLFSKTAEGQFRFIRKVPKRMNTQLFANIEKLASSIIVSNNPGNTYQFLAWTLDEKKARWVWNSSNRTKLDSDLLINYDIFMKLASNAPNTSYQ